LSFIRKLIIVLVGVSLALLVTVLLVNPASIISLAMNLETTSLLIRLPLVILIDVVILAIIVVLVRSERQPRPNDALIVKAQGVHADVSIDSARERLLRAVRDVPDVISAQANVKAIRGKADIDLDVVVSRDSMSVPDKQKEIDRALRQVINKQLGLQMAGKPRVHIRMEDAALPAVVPVVAAPAAEQAPPVIVPAVVEAPVLVQETVPEAKAVEAVIVADVENKAEADAPEPSTAE
jgi:hypothetical protein